MVGGRPILRGGLVDGVDRIAQRHAGRRLKEMVTDGNRPWWLTESGAVAGA